MAGGSECREAGTKGPRVGGQGLKQHLSLSHWSYLVMSLPELLEEKVPLLLSSLYYLVTPVW